MARPAAPLWLAEPGALASIGRNRALALVFAACALVAAVLVWPVPVGEGDGGSGAFSDLSLYESVIDGVAAGGGYYELTASALRAGDYPLRPFLTFRLPAHAVVQAWLPRSVTVLLLYALVAGVAAAWWWRLAPALARRAPRLMLPLLLAGGLVAFMQSDLLAFHEIWAAPLVALALALRRPGRWVEAAAVALVAMLVRETAALLPLVMGFCALIEGERREAVGWGAVLGVFAVAIAVHAWAVAQVTGPLDPASPGWSGLLGPRFALDSLAASGVLRLLPGWLAALTALAAIAGWAAWGTPLARRVALTLLGYAAALSLFARADTFYWALMMTPLWLLGLLAFPDAARDVVRAALDRPRVRVQRIRQ